MFKSCIFNWWSNPQCQNPLSRTEPVCWSLSHMGLATWWRCTDMSQEGTRKKRCWGWTSLRRCHPRWLIQLELRTGHLWLHSEAILLHWLPLRFPQKLQYLTSVCVSICLWKINTSFYIITITFFIPNKIHNTLLRSLNTQLFILKFLLPYPPQNTLCSCRNFVTLKCVR